MGKEQSSRPSRVQLFDASPIDPESDQAFEQTFASNAVHIQITHTRTNCLDGGELRREHDFIQIALRARKTPGRRPDSSHVSGPALGRFGTNVREQQVSLSQHAIVTLVVQYFTVNRDDRAVRAHAASTDD